MAERKQREKRGNTTTITNNNSETRANEIKRTIGQGSESTNSGNSENKSVGEIPKESLVSISSPPKPIIVEIPESVQASTNEKKVRKTPTRGKKEVVISQTEISNLIMGIFSLVSLKAGEHWAVTQDEASQVGKPLESILKKMDLLEKVTNASDGAMLLFAVVSITLPRVLITKAINSENKRQVQEQLKGGATIGKLTRIPDNTEKIETGSSTESSESNNIRIKEEQSISSKHDNPLYSTDAQ